MSAADGVEDVETWIRGLPKAELHVHLQGAASVATVLGPARRHPDAKARLLAELDAWAGAQPTARQR